MPVSNRTLVVILALTAVLATAVSSLTTVVLSKVSPAADHPVASHRVPLFTRYQGLPASCSFMVDGQALPGTVNASRKTLQAVAPFLSDGTHRVEVVAARLLFMGTVHLAWDVTVDSRPPTITLQAPASGALIRGEHLTVEGRTKPGAAVQVTMSGGQGQEARADALGLFSIPVTLAQGPVHLTVRAVDRAGNHFSLARRVVCDTTPPNIVQMQPAEDAVLKETPDFTIHAHIDESGSGLRRVTLTLDGTPHELKLPSGGGDVTFASLDQAEGRRQVELEAEDQAGWVTSKKWSVLVDTTERFGTRSTTLGAVGKDVLALQHKLVHRGVLAKDECSGTFDERTEQALREFQSTSHIEVSGKLDFSSIAALSPRIYIDLAHFTLDLFDGTNKLKTYKIAHGMIAYPTPSGHFRITYLERNPTWYPPKGSIWAKEAKVTPPGPGNPLGTRWIGLNSSSVGIHGTPMSWSIGSRASHGCIRMRIPDVEDLFDRVNPGSEVTISWKAEPRQVSSQ